MLPVNVTTVNVTGHWTDLQGKDCTGTVTFDPAPCSLTDADESAFVQGPVTVPLIGGRISVDLPCTTQKTLNPVGWTYLVTPRVSCLPCSTPFSIALDCEAIGPTGTIDLAKLRPIDTSTGQPMIVGPQGPPGPAGAKGDPGSIDATLAPGTGISFTGKGTPADPYNINSTDTLYDVVERGKNTADVKAGDVKAGVLWCNIRMPFSNLDDVTYAGIGVSSTIDASVVYLTPGGAIRSYTKAAGASVNAYLRNYSAPSTEAMFLDMRNADGASMGRWMADGWIYVRNASPAPTSSPGAGVVLYAEGSQLKVIPNGGKPIGLYPSGDVDNSLAIGSDGGLFAYAYGTKVVGSDTIDVSGTGTPSTPHKVSLKAGYGSAYNSNVDWAPPVTPWSTVPLNAMSADAQGCRLDKNTLVLQPGAWMVFGSYRIGGNGTTQAAYIRLDNVGIADYGSMTIDGNKSFLLSVTGFVSFASGTRAISLQAQGGGAKIGSAALYAVQVGSALPGFKGMPPQPEPEQPTV